MPQTQARVGTDAGEFPDSQAHRNDLSKHSYAARLALFSRSVPCAIVS